MSRALSYQGAEFSIAKVIIDPQFQYASMAALLSWMSLNTWLLLSESTLNNGLLSGTKRIPASCRDDLFLFFDFHLKPRLLMKIISVRVHSSQITKLFEHQSLISYIPSRY